MGRKSDRTKISRWWLCYILALVEYAALVFFPFLGAPALWVCAVTIVGYVFVVPALPIFVLGHARYLGGYAERYLTDC